jgi:uncharacterized protein involved in outer membrane biogenesis
MASVASVSARARQIAGAPRARKILWWIGGLIVAFAVIGFFVVPPIAKSQMEEALSNALHRKVTVEQVRVNPFAPSATLRGFLVGERQGDAPFASFEELYVDIGWTSIFRLAPVVESITLTKPHVRVVRNADQTYNFKDLLDEFLARPKSNDPIPRFALFNIQVVDGQIDVDDRAASRKHTVTALRIGIPFVSSLPSHIKINVLPELSANVNGASFALKGDSLPFAETHTTTLKLDLDAFDITRLVEYVPVDPRPKVRSGLLDARLTVSFEQPAGKVPQIKVRGGAALRDVSALDLDSRPALAWKRLAIDLDEVDPLAPRVSLKSVRVEGADLHVWRDKNGELNLQRTLAAGRKTAAAARSEGQAKPLVLQIAHLVLASAKVRVTDESVSPAFNAALEDVQLEGKAIDLGQGKRSEWSLRARSDAGETVSLTSAASFEPLAATGRIEAGGLKLKRYGPYVKSAADLELDDGELDLALAFDWAIKAAASEERLKISDVALALKGLRARLPGEKDPFARVASLEIKGAGADLAAQTASLGEIAVREIAAGLRREKDGRLNVERIARTQAKPAAAPGSERAWAWEVAQLSIERGSLALEDLALAQPVRTSIAPFQLKAQKLSSAKGQRGTISLQATIDKNGTLSASGPLTLDPPAATLAIAAKTIGFVQAQRYAGDEFNLAVTSGAVSGKGTLSVALPPGGALRASYRGDLSVTEFASTDKRSTQDLLRWKNLSFGAIDFELTPLKIALDEIALADFYARIIVSAEGRLNLQDLAGTPATPAAVEPPKPAAEKPPVQQVAAETPKPAAAPVALARNLRIGKITMQGGNVEFSDFFIKPNYSANLTGLAGSVGEMSADKAGDVELRGKVAGSAPLEILGRVNPLAPSLFLDLKASARDIELPPLSPYAAKYAGYGITRGKLSMTVKYHVENQKLTAENNLHLDQLTFGEKVDSPSAIQAPVLLAVALLKDRNGVIDIDLPISGSLDDPQFSIGGIIVKVIVNLIVKAVTAPFALIGSMFGGGEELAYVEFAPGSAALGAETAKLKNLGKALTERPGLRLDVTGRVDPEVDREGLKRASIDSKVKVQKLKELRTEGEASSSVTVKVESAEYEKYLRRAYGDEKFTKPRNVIGMAKDLPVPEMESLMLANTQVTDDDLRLLANARAEAAKAWLVDEAKVPAERVFIVAPKLSAEGISDKGKPTRADFSLK